MGLLSGAVEVRVAAGEMLAAGTLVSGNNQEQIRVQLRELLAQGSSTIKNRGFKTLSLIRFEDKEGRVLSENENFISTHSGSGRG
jgi:hypothetical protein